MRLLFNLLTLFLVSVTLHAQVRPLDEAKAIAADFLGNKSVEVVSHTSDYCVFQTSGRKGFVVVSLHSEAARSVIGFSTESNWNTDQIPPALSEVLKHQACLKSAAILKGRRAQTDSKTDIEPLLTCHWHQNSPYNDLSPVIADGNVKTVAGCVAIAAAQITYYWRRDNPEYTLRDTPTYIYGGAPVTEVIPKGSPNNWNLIRDRYTSSDSPESRAAAAQLCYVLGTTSYLNYASSTGGSIFDASNAMYSQFRLRSSYITRAKCTQEQWETILYGELNMGRPVMCGGIDEGGHAFVLDGYDSKTNLFHFNFGWGGSGDGYYPVDDSDDSMGGFSKGQEIVYGIHPNTRNIQTSIDSHIVYGNTNQLEATVLVTNNSTLPISSLQLYVSSNSSALDESAEMLWQSDEPVSNDGVEYTIPVSVPLSLETGNYTLYLSDESRTVLTKSAIEVTTDINNVTFDNLSNARVFTANGIRVTDTKRKGMYILQDGKRCLKVIYQ